MNKKGKTQRERLLKAIEDMNDTEAINLFGELAVKKAELGERALEPLVYPTEFLNVMAETGYQALKDWLTEHNAPVEVHELVDDLIVLNTWTWEVEKSDGLVGWHVNGFLIDTVASLTRHVVQAGGVFHGPYGKTGRGEVD